MSARQNGACAICRKKPDERLCIDHSHATRKLRDLLCRKCNGGLGCYDDDPVLVRAAADYLERWQRAHEAAGAAHSRFDGQQPPNRETRKETT